MAVKSCVHVNIALRDVLCIHEFITRVSRHSPHHQFAPERFTPSHSEENVAFISRRVSAVSNFSW